MNIEKYDNPRPIVLPYLPMILCTVLLLLALLPTKAQDRLGTDSPAPNHVRTYTPQVPLRNISEVIDTGSPADKVMVDTEYIGGLGRVLQRVQRQASPEKRDLVQMYTIDGLGRSPKALLPYEGPADRGAYRRNAAQEQADFYLRAAHVAHDRSPYALRTFEASPLKRVRAQGAPGEVWQPENGHARTTAHEVGSGPLPIRYWSLDGEGLPRWDRTPQGSSLYRDILTDEEGRRTISYTDIRGQLLLQRVQAAAAVDTVTYRSGDWADTYYLYDLVGNLRYVFPPQMVAEMEEKDMEAPDRAFLDTWAFQYRYDGRGRITRRKVPGAGWEYRVYDRRDRLILSQDAHLRAGKLWRFIKYDSFDRPVLSGLYRHTVQVDPQAIVDFDGGVYNQILAKSGATLHGYSYSGFPSDLRPEDCYEINYYDDYDFPHAGSYPFRADELNPRHEPRVKGRLTGSKVRVLGEERWLESVTYYDERYRPIQVRESHHLGGHTAATRYDFQGRVLETKDHYTQGHVPDWESGTAVTYQGNTVLKAGAMGWGSHTHSRNRLAPDEEGSLRYTVTDRDRGRRVIGLSTAVLAGADSPFLDYGLLFTGQGGIQIYTHGNARTVPGIGYVPGDEFRIVKRQGRIHYYRNNDRFLSVAYAGDPVLYAAVKLHSPGVGVSGLELSFGPGAERTLATVRSYFDRDHAGRPLRTWHRVDEGPKVLLSEQHYNALGELVEKNLHGEGDGSFRQSIDYRYNIRGWTTSINSAELDSTPDNPDVDGPRDLFGMELYYERPPADLAGRPQYGGNIAAQVWGKALGGAQGGQKAHSYRYDALDRLQTARHFVHGTDWSATAAHGLSELSYDLNGNIRSLHRSDASGGPMDRLRYDYGAGGNRLRAVTDSGDTARGFRDGTHSGPDYRYDGGGNLISDANKEIDTIRYNYLNLPERIVRADGSHITYTYDAMGNKLGSKTVEIGDVERHRADFGRGRDGWSPFGASVETVAGSVLGESGVLRVRAAPGHSNRYLYRFDEGLYEQRARITTLVYIPTTNTHINGVRLSVDGAAHSTDLSAAERWQELSFELPADHHRQVRLHLTEDGLLRSHATGAVDDDLIYVRDIRIELLDVPVAERRDYVGPLVLEDGRPALIRHGEGRLVAGKAPSGESKWTYQYHLRDHLGNVRLTFTTAPDTLVYTATMEDARAAREEALFEHLPETRVSFPMAAHSPDRVAELHIGRRIGPAKTLLVGPGDRLDIGVWAYHEGHGGNTATLAPTSMTAAIAAAFGGINGGTEVQQFVHDALAAVPGLVLGGNSAHPEAPAAYLNYLLFDGDMTLLDMGHRPVTGAGLFARERLFFDPIEVKESGFAYIYVSYEGLQARGRVFFDDLEIVHREGPVVQADDYYPFGLTFNSYQRAKSTENKFLYNGKEKIEELDLGWYDYGARNYDAALGRFFNQDRFAEKYYPLSPYQYTANNPINYIDVNGDSIWFSFQRNKQNEITGVTMNVTGKVLNASSRDVDVDEAISDISDGISSSFSGTVTVNGKEASFSTNVQLSEATSIDQVEASDHLVVLANATGQEGSARASSNQIGGKVIHADASDFPEKGGISGFFGISNTRSVLHEFGHLSGLEHNGGFLNLMKQGARGSYLSDEQLQKSLNRRGSLNLGANVVTDSFTRRRIPNPILRYRGSVGHINQVGLSIR